MKSKKVLSLVATVVLISGVLAGCSSKSGGSSSGTKSKEVKITMLNSKGEIQSQLEDAAKEFKKTNPNIKLDVVVTGNGQSPFEKISAMYASGNAPTLAMLDPTDIIKLNDKFEDLSKQKWIADTVDNSLDTIKTSDGKVPAFPFTIEGAGFIYNKTILDKAGVDPASIKTLNDLKSAFDKIKAKGSEALAICSADWSLAGHFLSIAYADQSNDPAKVNEFFDQLKAGKVDLTKNKPFNGLIDTFDVMKKYNIDKKDPLSATYENNQQQVGTGKVAFWFNGNWAWPQIKQFAGDNDNFGFIPVPVSNNASDYGNSGIPAGVTKYIGVDNTTSTKAQKAAAEKFLNWIVYDKNGQDFLVNKSNIIPAFKNITLEPSSALAKSIKQYIKDGKTIQFITTTPSDHWSKVGVSMQKYLASKIDRAELAKEIQNYWKNVGK
ncbi:ABC transporter substrate-binding protein [Clostridium oryzae]|uniref:Multiple sugar-binding protein n=1 Tax=Clostridium oryzae TaxID=1450648 RepID=A0A1V4IRJ9_9CLOT|nr:ABC transporter substrate-binding protein [Clostridium oryzae]OPJ62533.1 multiple sugar-binding protein precursor [Clostridium oryzae]